MSILTTAIVLLSLSSPADAAKRPVTFVADPSLSEGPIENFLELFIDPYKAASVLNPLKDVSELRPRAFVTEDRIDINDRIFFAPNSSNIRPSSNLILNEVAYTLNHRPDIAEVSIHGHLDSLGGTDRNLTLSVRRAKAVVDYLVAQGVSPQRLTSIGFGDTRKSADSEGGNQNVEFVIEKWGKGRPPADAAPEATTEQNDGPTTGSLLIENKQQSSVEVSINGQKIGILGPLTDGAIHGLTSGLYDVNFTDSAGYSSFEAVRTGTVKSPIVPGGKAATSVLPNNGLPQPPAGSDAESSPSDS